MPINSVTPLRLLLLWMLFGFPCTRARADKLGRIHVVSVDDFGVLTSGVDVSVKDHEGKIIFDASKELPYGSYHVAVRKGLWTTLDRDIDLDQPVKTVFAYEPGYYGDFTQLPSMSVIVSGLPKNLRVFARALSLYGNLTSEVELDGEGRGAFADVTPGIYVVAVFSGERILAQGSAIFIPTQKMPVVRLRVDPDRLRSKKSVR